MTAVLSIEELSKLSDPPAFDYALYGLRIRSRMRLTLDHIPTEGTANVELQPGDSNRFESIAAKVDFDQSDWIHKFDLPDGWTYLRYDELFEFLVSPSGDQILYRMLGNVSVESFQTYALGRVFSFALVKMGFEPLHAATVVVDGKAIAFLGASTFGKSSLAACFVAGGHQLLTDDTLRVEERDGQYVAFPGPPRLRLLPKVARLYLGSVSDGVLMNPREKDAKGAKLVFRLSESQSFAKVANLSAIYVVTAPRKVHRKQSIKISSLSPLQSLLNLLSFTHNDQLFGSERLKRQLDAAQRLIEKVPVRSLSYPRVLASLNDVRESVIEDLEKHVARI